MRRQSRGVNYPSTANSNPFLLKRFHVKDLLIAYKNYKSCKKDYKMHHINIDKYIEPLVEFINNKSVFC